VDELRARPVSPERIILLATGEEGPNDEAVVRSLISGLTGKRVIKNAAAAENLFTAYYGNRTKAREETSAVMRVLKENLPGREKFLAEKLNSLNTELAEVTRGVITRENLSYSVGSGPSPQMHWMFGWNDDLKGSGKLLETYANTIKVKFTDQQKANKWEELAQEKLACLKEQKQISSFRKL